MPTHKEMYVELHSSGGTHCNNKVVSFEEKFNIRKAELESLTSKTGSPMPSDDEIWFEIIGGPKKGRWTAAQTQTSATPTEGAIGGASGSAPVDNTLVNSVVNPITPMMMQMVRDMCANTATTSGTSADDAEDEATSDEDDDDDAGLLRYTREHNDPCSDDDSDD